MTKYSDMPEFRDEYEEITRQIQDLEVLLAAAKKSRNKASDDVIAVYDAGIRDYERHIETANEERDRLSKRIDCEEAYESPLGQLASAAFRDVQYDYASSEDYPGIVAAMQKIMDDNGWELHT